MAGHGVHFPHHPLLSPGKIGSRKPLPTGKGKEGNWESFAQVLQRNRTKGDLHFSTHARRRMEARNITLGPGEIGKLEEAVDKAAAKGCRSSLLLYRDIAFVAGIANRTIITALDSKNMEEHVFTNIDSAVVIK
ncbi:MAG: TIGR02530 family flagellar biosynthesis protein [Dethiobacteria bacterium]|jgi:flagellar operon protein